MGPEHAAPAAWGRGKLTVASLAAVACLLLTVFAQAAHAGGTTADLNVAPQGSGSGSIGGTNTHLGNIISCTWNGVVAGGDCTHAIAGVSGVTLTATASVGSTFTGWNGCPGTVSGPTGNVCSYQVQSPADDYVIRPEFQLPRTLTTIVTGSGMITSDPAGVSCHGEDISCDTSFLHATLVKLTPQANPGWVFDRWELPGACNQNEPVCEVPMDGDQTARAIFKKAAVRLTVQVEGDGRVTSSLGGIDCNAGNSPCVADFDPGTWLTLKGTPNAARFEVKSWSGVCAGTLGGSCTLQITTAITVKVTFGKVPPRPLKRVELISKGRLWKKSDVTNRARLWIAGAAPRAAALRIRLKPVDGGKALVIRTSVASVGKYSKKLLLPKAMRRKLLPGSYNVQVKEIGGPVWGTAQIRFAEPPEGVARSAYITGGPNGKRKDTLVRRRQIFARFKLAAVPVTDFTPMTVTWFVAGAKRPAKTETFLETRMNLTTEAFRHRRLAKLPAATYRAVLKAGKRTVAVAEVTITVR